MLNKKRVFGIVLFLLLGFFALSFANPSDDNKVKEDGQTIGENENGDKKDEQTPKQEENTTEDNNLNNNNNNGNNNGNNNANNNGNNNVNNNENVLNEIEKNKENAATKAVELAEKTLTQKDVDEAKVLVDGLKDGAVKTDLTDRLKKVQEAINEKNKENAATKAVELAEKTLTQKDVDEAKVLVDGLKDGAVKTDLTDRLNKVQEAINEKNKENEATKAVELAEKTLTQKDVDIAKVLVDGLKDGAVKTDLTDRLNKVQEAINEKNKENAATKAVELAEKTLTQKDVDEAKVLVDGLKDGAVKTDLTDRLNKVQEIINENNKIAKAKVLVKIAENSLNQKDVDVARKFVEGLKDSKAKTDLLARLDRVQEIIDEIARIDAATKAVEKAEFERIQANVDVAQLLVNKVTAAKTKEALQNRLDRVQETINAVKELTELLKTKYDKEKYTTNSYNNYEQAVAKVLDENGNVIVSNLTAGEIIALTNDIRNAINNLELLKLLSISLSSTGKEYVRNEVQENIVVTAIYNDTLRNKVLAINPNEKFNSSVVTKTPLVLTYTFEGVTATYTYTVVRNSSDQELVSLYAGLDKKEYYRGETEYTLTVTSYDKDQTENVVTDYVLLNEFDTSTVGPHYLKVSYTKNGKTVTVNAHYVVKRSFEDQQLKSLDVFMPTYTFPFNSEIGVYSVFVTEGDGTRYEVTKDAVITNFYTTEEGKRIMTVSYTNASGKTIKKDIEYTVLPPKSLAKLIGLQVTLAKRTFGLNEELGTYKVIATYSDKTTKDVTSLVRVDGFDTTTLGKKVMKFVYYKSSSEKGEAYKNYEVIRSEEGQKLDRIEATFGDKSVFFKGESLSNLVVTAYDKDGTKHEVKDNFTTNFDSTTAGEKILTVTYNGITTTLKYTVLENPLDLIQNIDFSLNEGFYKGLGYSYYLVVKNMDNNVKINSITAYDNGINDSQSNVEFTIDENGYRLNSEDFHNIIYNNTTVSNHFVTIKYTVYGRTYTALYTEEFNKLYFYQYV